MNWCLSLLELKGGPQHSFFEFSESHVNIFASCVFLKLQMYSISQGHEVGLEKKHTPKQGGRTVQSGQRAASAQPRCFWNVKICEPHIGTDRAFPGAALDRKSPTWSISPGFHARDARKAGVAGRRFVNHLRDP